MKTVLVINADNASHDAIQQAALDTDWNFLSKSARTAVAVVVFLADKAGLEPALMHIASAKRSGAVVVLVTDLSRSGWEGVFGAAHAPDVDALFGLPLDAPAILRRLDGIMAARLQTHRQAAVGMAVILDRASANEESAAAFYRQAASRSRDPVTRDALEGLMRDELEHKQLIAEFKSGARPLPEGTTSGGSLVECLTAPDFAADMSPPDAFLLAAKKEKLAVEFYENWASLYPEGAERDLLLRLAEIERRHKAKVEDLFTNAAFPEAW